MALRRLAYALPSAVHDVEKADHWTNYAKSYFLGRITRWTMTKPAVFISSSLEGLATARELGRQLQDVADVTTWSEGAFQLRQSAAESLAEAADHSDFAVFVLAADDSVGGRHSQWSPRPNVIFEMGFLAGRLGLSRTFVVVADSRTAVPTDLAGTMCIALNTRSSPSIELAVAPAVDAIRRAMKEVRPRAQKAAEYYSCFISYSWKDNDFVASLYDDLHQVGIRCWLDEKELRAGARLADQIDRAIQAHDKVLLVLSHDSIRSAWVRLELRNALRLERERRKTVLFPLRLDDAPLEMAGSEFEQLREKYISDFSDWRNRDSYRHAFSRLVRDLAISASVESARPS
jgi:predicted nucleotide-binding protein